MTRINLKLVRRIGSVLALTFLSVLLMGLIASRANADAPRTIRLLDPLDGATVRESVPIKISPADLPADGYVVVSVDKVFRTARLIDRGTSLIYTWDTQASYQDTNDPGVDKYSEDGNHEIEVSVYDRQGSLLAQGTSNVKLANTVSNLPDGINLSYNWSEDATLRYKRHSELNELSTGNGAPAQNVQTADIRFSRSVEDSTGGEYLVRDLVYNDGILLIGGTSTPVQDLFSLKSRYRTVNRFGDVLVEETPFSNGDHFGFPITEVPARRITVGDSWQAKIETSLTWANAKPTELLGSARLDSFEWQNGYPTAKIIETYDGPAQFYADARGTVQFSADNVHLVRTYWFAYNSKRLVRVRTDMTIDASVTSDVLSLIGGGSSGIAAEMGAPGPYGSGGFGPQGPGSVQNGPGQFQNPYGGNDGGDQSPQSTTGQVGVGGPTTTVKLEVTDDTRLAGV